MIAQTVAPPAPPTLDDIRRLLTIERETAPYKPRLPSRTAEAAVAFGRFLEVNGIAGATMAEARAQRILLSGLPEQVEQQIVKEARDRGTTPLRLAYAMARMRWPLADGKPMPELEPPARPAPAWNRGDVRRIAKGAAA